MSWREARARALTLLGERQGRVHEPLRVLTWCPACGLQHVDRNGWAKKLHKTHKCAACGECWRVADIYTVGVEVL